MRPLETPPITPSVKKRHAAGAWLLRSSMTAADAGSAGKAADHYDMARDGIADMTWVNPGYQAGRFPLYAAGELPFLTGKPGGASAALDAWYRPYVAKEMADVKFCFAHLHVGALEAAAVRRIGVLALGEAMTAEVCVARVAWLR